MYKEVTCVRRPHESYLPIVQARGITDATNANHLSIMQLTSTDWRVLCIEHLCEPKEVLEREQ